MIDGTARRTPVALVDIDCSYYKGVVEAVCMKQPMYDVIVGNIPGVHDQSWQQECSVQLSGTNVEGELEEQIQAVTTRVQSRTSKETKPLKVIEAIGCDISAE